MQRASTGLVVLLLLGGCTEERHARVVVEAAPGATLEIATLEVAARLDPSSGGARRQAETLPSGNSRGITLPADFVVLLPDGAGTLAVSATARDGDGISIASGRTSAPIPSSGTGRVATLTLVLGEGSDAGCRDGVAVPGELCYGPSFVNIDGRSGGAALLDFDGDGLRDLVAGVTFDSDNGERGLSLQRARGGDRFETPTRLVGPVIGEYRSASVVAGELDGDGLADVVVGGAYEQPALLSRSGTSRLGPLQSVAEENRGEDPRLADLDGDGNLDLVTHGGHFVYALLGDGRGTLTPGGDFTFDAETYAIDVGEVDQYPGPDVVVSSNEFRGRPQRVTILGWQDGQFVVRAGLEDVPAPRDIAVAELDGTPPAEMVTIDGSELTVYRVEAEAMVAEPPLTVEPTPTSNRLTILESVTAVHRAGAPDDVAVALSGDPWNDPRDVVTLVLLRPEPSSRTLSEVSRANLHCSRGYLTADDADGDGNDEILVVCNETSGYGSEGVVIVHVNDDGLDTPVRGDSVEVTVDVGDLDGDGRPDLVYTEGSHLYVQIGADEPTLAPVSEAGQGSSSFTRPLFTDLDGDGQEDVGALCPRCNEEDGQIWTFTRTGIGWSHDGIAVPGLDPNDGGSPRRPMALAAANLVDGGPPLLVAALVDGNAVVWTADGLVEVAGALAEPGGDDVRMDVGQIDDQPGEDVAVTWADGQAVVLFRADGAGGLLPGEMIATQIGDGEPGPLAIGDVDGDGQDELVVTRRNGRDVWTFGWRDGAIEALGSFEADVSVYSASLLDLDGDGVDELVCAGLPKIAVYSLRSGGPEPRLYLPGSRSFYDRLHPWPRPGSSGSWVPPMLWTSARTEAGDSDWQTYEVLWRPSP